MAEPLERELSAEDSTAVVAEALIVAWRIGEAESLIMRIPADLTRSGPFRWFVEAMTQIATSLDKLERAARILIASEHGREAGWMLEEARQRIAGQSYYNRD